MNKFSLLTLFILSSFYVPISFAHFKCDKKTDIHCTTFIGDNSKKNGRYIKSTLISKNAISHIHCISGGLSDVIPKAFNHWNVGKVKFRYEQCLNAKCRESKFLAVDEFTIKRKGKDYTSYPHSSKVYILNNYGEPCIIPAKS